LHNGLQEGFISVHAGLFAMNVASATAAKIVKTALINFLLKTLTDFI